MGISTWQEIAGYMCDECGLPATHFYEVFPYKVRPLCCQCHQRMGSHFLIPLFTYEDTKLAHDEMILKEKRKANKYDEQGLLEYIKNKKTFCIFCSNLKEGNEKGAKSN